MTVNPRLAVALAAVVLTGATLAGLSPVEAHGGERANRLVERIDEAVADGKLTAAQKQLILEKHAELRAWAEQHGIDAQYLRPFGHGVRAHHR